MTVHNLAEYVKYHQEKLRQQQTQAAQSSPSSTPQTSRRKGGVNHIHSKASFETSILKAPADVLVVVDYFATWCGPCKAIAPIISEWSNLPEFDNVQFVKIDVDENPEIAQDQGIRAMPTFAIFKNGEKIEEVIGADPRKLRMEIEKHK